ncbi:GNAT family N-acetyltransferase [Pleurocapsa sp. PCC 7319]|uniref:GNAT family N-acetyltransferase n=1 Tax=Pleurocapsa sp. PCC 7319 TaxID=118161 RepID=UPI00035DD7AC|nr:GNAT family N-acetyltransferase [Pleurocapsa sp. PCC 7319]
MKLRKLSDSDFEFLLRLLTDSEVREYLGGAVPFNEAKKRVSTLLNQKPKSYWVIEVKDSPIGTVVFGEHVDSGEVELSYQLLPEYVGQGLAFKAVQEALRNNGSSLVVAETQVKNFKSRKLLARLGFKEIKRLERFGEVQAYYELRTKQ